MTPPPSARILFVDDDPNLIAGIERNLRRSFTLDTATSGAEALEMIANDRPYAVIVADMSMPVMNGAELLERVRASSPDTVRIMLTGNADQKSAADAVNRGQVHRFLSKPCPNEELAAVLVESLQHHRLIVAEKALLDETLNGALKALADILAVLDPEAFGQAQQRRTLARMVAHRLGSGSSWDVEIAALLADLGRVVLPPGIREKVRGRQPLTDSERRLVERVPEFGAKLLAPIPRMESVAQAILHQNKNVDGSGFPPGPAAGADLPLGGRVLRVVSSFLGMQDRGIPTDDAIRAILVGPEHYDPAVARVLAGCLQPASAAPRPASPGVRSLPLEKIRSGCLLLADVATVEGVVEITPGCTLVDDVRTVDGVVVLKAGTQLDAANLQRLRTFASLHPIVEPITLEIPGARTPESADPAEETG